MALSFYSISTFRNSIENICRREKYGYNSCIKDICDLLKPYSFDSIWEMNYRVRDLDNIRVIKIRIQNSLQNLSSSDGFRLIVCCNKKYQSVIFLNIYPKRGKLGQLDQSKEEFKQQLKNYLTSFQNNQLVQHNIDNELEIIEPNNVR
jgi:hypothetical protein